MRTQVQILRTHTKSDTIAHICIAGTPAMRGSRRLPKAYSPASLEHKTVNKACHSRLPSDLESCKPALSQVCVCVRVRACLCAYRERKEEGETEKHKSKIIFVQGTVLQRKDLERRGGSGEKKGVGSGQWEGARRQELVSGLPTEPHIPGPQMGEPEAASVPINVRQT